MRIEFELQEAEYHEAARAVGRTDRDSYRPMRLAGYAGASIGFALQFGSDRHTWLAPVVLILLGLFIPIYPVWLGWRKLNDGWKNFSRAGTLVIEFSDDAIVYETIYSSTRYSWYAFDRFLETPQLFLIFRSGQPVIIPKRAIREQQDVGALRAMLKNCASRPARAFAVKV